MMPLFQLITFKISVTEASANAIDGVGSPLHSSFVVVQLYNPLTLQPGQSGGQGSILGKAPSLERHNKGSHTRLVLS